MKSYVRAFFPNIILKFFINLTIIIMKISKYIHIIPESISHSYWFNALTRSFFKLTKELSDKVEKTLNSGNFNLLPDIFLDQLKRSGMVIDDEFDELEAIRNLHQKASNTSSYTLQILPTLNCNYKCWYCIQDHITSKMSDQVMDNIIKHLEIKMNSDDISELRIEWFGGEPLMYYSKTIIPLSKRIKDICEKVNKPYTQGVTSNAYFLTSEVSKELGKYNFNHFQITLDGNRENHDKVKFQKGCDSAFDRALKHIVEMLNNIPDMQVTLRINYTYDSMDERIVGEVCERVPQNLRDRIQIFPRKVWQEEPDKTKRIGYEDIWGKFEKEGFFVKKEALVLDFRPCYTNNSNFLTANYNGTVVKCTACNDMYTPNGLGSLNNDGSVSWHDSRGTEYDKPTFENEKCIACKYLPICMGICPRDHVKRLSYCKLDKADMSFEYEILAYIHENEVLKNRL